MGWKPILRGHVMTSALVILLLAFSPCAAGENEEDLQCIRSFFSDVLHREVVSVKKGRYDNSLQSGCLITQYFVNEDCVVNVSDIFYTIIYFYRKGMECASSGDSPSISREAAFKVALPIIRYHRLPEDQAQYRIVRENDGPGIGDVWIIDSSGFIIDGFPCIGRGIVFRICADTGDILIFTYSHPLPVEPVGSSVIPRDEAIARVGSWLDIGMKSERYDWKGWIDNNSIAQVRRVIVSVNGVAYRTPGGALSEDRMYHCWEVPIIMKERGMPPYPGPTVYMRVDTGDVLGVR